MRHFDLFSGIGGFALAARWAGFETIGFSEIEPFCCELLKKRFEGIKNYGDIRKINGHEISADIITGGFPCQPFSCAGKQRGKEDDRYLWPEMLRVISEVKPSWIVGENVAGIINMEFEQMLSDLEVQGYEIQPLIIPACAVNAPHRRDRVWIIAHSGCEHGQGQYERGRTKKQINPENATEPERPIEGHRAGIDTNSDNRRQEERKQQTAGNKQCDCDDSNSPAIGLQRGFVQDNRKRTQSGDEQSIRCSESWNESWLEVAAELCRVDDGISVELDGFKLSKSKHRECRLKGLGNAIVPQIPYIIFNKIKEIENASKN
jgi:DNA (cytosine-5)-methyltransferase 1